MYKSVFVVLQFNEMLSEMGDAQELAQSRQQELEKLQDDYQNALKQIEKLKMDVS